jgi:putative oxidoreductase
MSRLSFGGLYKHREFAPLVLRIIVGLIFMLHGWMKITGIEGTTGFFGGLGIPIAPLMAWYVALVELVGGLALILGAFTRLLAILNGIDMVVVLLLVKMSGLLERRLPLSLMPAEKWPGAELELLLLAACVALAILGGGKWALDQRIFGQDRE